MGKVEWKRLLWLQQDYPDNYTDQKFLEKVKDYENKKLDYANSPYLSVENYRVVRSDFLNFFQTVLNTSIIYIIFAYIYIYDKDPTVVTVLVTSVIASIVLFKEHDKDQLSSLLNLKSVIIIIFSMLTLSPILKSLSKTTASDSVWTLSFWLTLWYISSISSSKEIKTSNVSTNLLVAVVSILSSRLSTSTHVFCFLFLCIQINVVLPNLLISSTVLFMLSNSFAYMFITHALGWMYTFCITLTTLLYIWLLPKWFIYWQVHYRMLDDANTSSKEALLTSWDAKKPILD
ncbi:hypothetical protein TPHA_0I01870 [Tetrapisispora phaffii CBS 4417]|uniref:Phosphatidylinositol N-acetylglucosaminyltransferase n=1 Tax=Tetrapisispora phaffii (strain ATCC 24235 / CBS 4417 / NBRC 1672 / NRRL Y-8282 / UCD 70-5) TaxID=1071381 RepID=G8BXR3_TETPH|nr:hypothetical protein TPHA_0I01870 [Tetrapisispora phaffii CBS 4417]CCE64691.1 hypothetical protein TPHA_0I01870 [Tetrapisispora phaffii CBS 4417]